MLTFPLHAESVPCFKRFIFVLALLLLQLSLVSAALPSAAILVTLQCTTSSLVFLPSNTNLEIKYLLTCTLWVYPVFINSHFSQMILFLIHLMLLSLIFQKSSSPLPGTATLPVKYKLAVYLLQLSEPYFSPSGPWLVIKKKKKEYNHVKFPAFLNPPEPEWNTLSAVLTTLPWKMQICSITHLYDLELSISSQLTALHISEFSCSWSSCTWNASND